MRATTGRIHDDWKAKLATSGRSGRFAGWWTRVAWMSMAPS